MRATLLLLALGAPALLVGCQTTKDRLAWARKDGQIITGNQALTDVAKSDEVQCKATAAQATAGVQMPTSVAIGQYASGGFGTARQAAVQDNIASTTMEACMDTRGYRLIKVPEGQPYTPPRGY